MNDGTRAPAGGWLDGLCSPDLQEHLERAVGFGTAVAAVVAWWAEAAAELISEFEAGVRGREVPYEVLDAVTRLVGVDQLYETVDAIAGLVETVGQEARPGRWAAAPDSAG
jgi:hypothetical protein